MLLLLFLSCFDLFVDFIHNVLPQEEVENLWHIKESKTNVGIGHSQGVQLQNIGMNFNMFLYHAPT
jgi:hypothetical protein